MVGCHTQKYFLLTAAQSRRAGKGGRGRGRPLLHPVIQGLRLLLGVGSLLRFLTKSSIPSAGAQGNRKENPMWI